MQESQAVLIALSRAAQKVVLALQVPKALYQVVLIVALVFLALQATQVHQALVL